MGEKVGLEWLEAVDNCHIVIVLLELFAPELCG
jgi:hypothetical protein